MEFPNILHGRLVITTITLTKKKDEKKQGDMIDTDFFIFFNLQVLALNMRSMIESISSLILKICYLL